MTELGGHSVQQKGKAAEKRVLNLAQTLGFTATPATRQEDYAKKTMLRRLMSL